VRKKKNKRTCVQEELVEQKQLLVVYVNNLTEKKLLERTLLKSRVAITSREWKIEREMLLRH